MKVKSSNWLRSRQKTPWEVSSRSFGLLSTPSNSWYCWLSAAGYGKTVSHVIIGLKTAKGTKQLKLDPSIYESLQKERVEIGDVIYVEANSGAVKRQGRSDTFATEFDLEASETSIIRYI